MAASRLSCHINARPKYEQCPTHISPHNNCSSLAKPMCNSSCFAIQTPHACYLHQAKHPNFCFSADRLQELDNDLHIERLQLDLRKLPSLTCLLVTWPRPSQGPHLLQGLGLVLHLALSPQCELLLQCRTQKELQRVQGKSQKS